MLAGNITAAKLDNPNITLALITIQVPSFALEGSLTVSGGRIDTCTWQFNYYNLW